METINEEFFARALEMATKVLPLHRSISGSGIEEAFRVLGDYIPLEMMEFRTGEDVFDWRIPRS